jgi:hypothetical protein
VNPASGKAQHPGTTSHPSEQVVDLDGGSGQSVVQGGTGQQAPSATETGDTQAVSAPALANVIGPAAAQGDVQPGGGAAAGVVADRGPASEVFGPQASGGRQNIAAVAVESESVGGTTVATGIGSAPTVAPSMSVAPSAAPNQSGEQALGANPNVARADGSGPRHAPSPRSNSGYPLGSRIRNGGQGGSVDSAETPPAPAPEIIRAESDDAAVSAPRAAVALLAEALPIDVSALGRAFDQCLGQIDAMGETLEDLLASDGLWPWLAGTAVVSAAGALTCFWRQKSRYGAPALSNGDGAGSSWFPDPIARA